MSPIDFADYYVGSRLQMSDEPAEKLLRHVRKVLDNKGGSDVAMRKLVLEVELSLEDASFKRKTTKVEVVAKLIKQLAIKLGPLEGRPHEDLLHKATSFLKTSEGAAWTHAWFVSPSTVENGEQLPSPLVSGNTTQQLPGDIAMVVGGNLGVIDASRCSTYGEPSLSGSVGARSPGTSLDIESLPLSAASNVDTLQSPLIAMEQYRPVMLSNAVHRRAASAGQNAPGLCTVCWQHHNSTITIVKTTIVQNIVIQPRNIQPLDVQPPNVQPLNVQPLNVQPLNVQPPNVQPPNVQPPATQTLWLIKRVILLVCVFIIFLSGSNGFELF